MSLVLNTNDSSGFEVANKGGYPDYSQALLKPMSGVLPAQGRSLVGRTEEQITTDFTVDSTRARLDVNGTYINYLCYPLSSYVKDIGNIGNGGNGFGCPGTLRISSTGKVRIGLVNELEGGEIIGKEMKREVFCGRNATGVGNVTLTVTASVKLLHSDGTLTDIGTLGGIATSRYFSNFKRYYNSANIGGSNTIFFLSYSGNGVVAQKGDRIVADLTMDGDYVLFFGHEGSAFDCGILYGDSTNTPRGFKPRPIQVSID